MGKILILTSLFLVSCSTLSRDWSAWKITDVAENKREWKFCKGDLHGEEFHLKGMCYDSQECRFRKTIFGQEKTECRDKMLYCKWADIECMIKYDLLDNIIINKE